MHMQRVNYIATVQDEILTTDFVLKSYKPANKIAKINKHNLYYVPGYSYIFHTIIMNIKLEQISRQLT